jgi:fructose transport system substrate-binding protein
MIQRMGRAATLLAVATAAGVLVAGCGSDDASGGDKKVSVALITKNSTNPFFVTMQEGAKKAADAEGVKLTVAAGKADGDEAGQVQAIEDAIARGDRRPATPGCTSSPWTRRRTRRTPSTSRSPRTTSRPAS